MTGSEGVLIVICIDSAELSSPEVVPFDCHAGKSKRTLVPFFFHCMFIEHLLPLRHQGKF